MSAPQPPSVPPVTPYNGPYAAPYSTPAHPQLGTAIAPPAPRPSGALGIVAVIVAGLAALTPVTAALAAFQIGLGAGNQLALQPASIDFELDILTPVRGWVLLGEVSFWAGTALGVWALVQGIVAIASGRGRVAGIVAVTVAVVAPIVFGVATWVSLTTGLATGSTLGA
ncbi:MAG: hypothetical protein QM602_08770 [Microbacterium sp.]